MKKIIILLVSLSLLLTLSACGSKEDLKDTSNDSSVTEVNGTNESTSSEENETVYVDNGEYYTLMFEEINGIPTYLGVDLVFEILGEKELKITISNLELLDVYLTNLDDSMMDHAEYLWAVDFDGIADYSVQTASWAYEPGANTEKTIEEMEHTVALKDTKSYIVIADATVSHSDSALTWYVTLPDDAAFDYQAIKNITVMVFDTDEANQITRNYSAQ